MIIWYCYTVYNIYKGRVLNIGFREYADLSLNSDNTELIMLGDLVSYLRNYQTKRLSIYITVWGMMWRVI